MNEDQYSDPYGDPSSQIYIENPNTGYQQPSNNDWTVKIQNGSQLPQQKNNGGVPVQSSDSSAYSSSDNQTDKQSSALLIGVILGLFGWWWMTSE